MWDMDRGVTLAPYNLRPGSEVIAGEKIAA
jgi:hypothetical protein